MQTQTYVQWNDIFMFKSKVHFFQKQNKVPPAASMKSIPAEISHKFRRTNTAHIVAVSLTSHNSLHKIQSILHDSDNHWELVLKTLLKIVTSRTLNQIETDKSVT